MTKVYFKFARSDIYRKYFINFDWTVSEFIDKMNSVIQIEIGYDKVEFVQTMQNTDEISAEDADAIVRTTTTMREKFAEDIEKKRLAFYIRILPPGATVGGGGASEEEEVVNECSVCYSRENYLGNFFQCAHFMCETCRISCVAHGIQTCPECRSN